MSTNSAQEYIYRIVEYFKNYCDIYEVSVGYRVFKNRSSCWYVSFTEPGSNREIESRNLHELLPKVIAYMETPGFAEPQTQPKNLLAYSYDELRFEKTSIQLREIADRLNLDYTRLERGRKFKPKLVELIWDFLTGRSAKI